MNTAIHFLMEGLYTFWRNVFLADSGLIKDTISWLLDTFDSSTRPTLDLHAMVDTMPEEQREELIAEIQRHIDSIKREKQLRKTDPRAEVIEPPRPVLHSLLPRFVQMANINFQQMLQPSQH
jgi:hypothetical protein